MRNSSVIMQKFLMIIFLCGFLWTVINSASILGVLHVPSASHYYVGETILKELADKGHNVTIASWVRSKDNSSNYREIFLEGLYEILEEYRQHHMDIPKKDIISIMMQTSKMMNELAYRALKSQGMQKLLKSGEKFDLVMVEPFGNEALFGLAHAFNAHLSVISSAASMWVNHYVGNSAPYAIVPHGMTSFSDKMTFIERAANSVEYLIQIIFNTFLILPQQKKLYEEIFEDFPPFEETLKNVSLVLVNTHVVYETPRPYLPNMIPIGGVHVKKPKKLPQHLQIYLDNAKEGVIFFSLGSYLHSSYLPKEKQQGILRTFAKFPQKILWKFENENLANIPDNVIISKWFPQSDILAHPNTKLFITHGGLLSTIETLYRGVPILGIPVYADQYGNIAKLVSYGYGQSISLNNLTEDSLTEAIKEVLYNPGYRSNVVKNMEILRDQPDRPLDRAVFWIEHVIRHNGGRHLKSAAVDIPLYQYLLLDILGVLTGVFSIFVILIYIAVRKIYILKNNKHKRE